MRGRSRRFFDVIGASLILIALFPLFALAALITWAVNGRPVLFLQDRVGKNLKPIRVAKIRTMVLNAEEHHEDLVSGRFRDVGDFYIGTAIDDRVTPLGRVLRQTSIDEYPQLLSVLRGEMSLVGPRPMLPSEIKYLNANELRRFEVNPGLTGMAQVASRRKLPSHESIALDVEYVERLSPLVDILIVLKTPWVMARGTGGE